MIALVSPAKSLDFKSSSPISIYSESEFLDKSKELVDVLKTYSPSQISKLMKISLDLGTLNCERYQDWKRPFKVENAKQSIFAFTGDVYKGLDAVSMSEKNLKFSQKHFRILSGLYGMLKPLDLIQAYRLEMGTKMQFSEQHSNLYSFWNETLTDKLNSELKETKSSYILNLASNEYAKAINFKNIQAEVISPVFKDWKNGEYKIISFYAKKARGLMGRYFIDNELSCPEELKAFDYEGYTFDPNLSKDKPFTFTRKQ